MAKPRGFQFKQFFIEHSHCAMKVGTDSIMLGSWLEVGPARRILDVGTGSGILAVMLAQKSPVDCQISGIDIDEAAISQAKRNGQTCPWSSRLHFSQSSLQDFLPSEKFELILSNPPFFPVYRRSGEESQQVIQHAEPFISQQQRQTARHTGTLSHRQLLDGVASLLSDDGRFACVLPAQNSDELIGYAAELGLLCRRRLLVRAKPEGKIIRHLLDFCRYSLLSERDVETKQLSIQQADGEYSQAYMNLCQDYYLKF
jgi:tRNA1Val (adenine37-N6)-methyltransferase